MEKENNIFANAQETIQDLDFYDLDPEKGIINIGSDSENDIVVADPRVKPFHMILVCSEKPYQIIPLDPDAEIFVRGVKIEGDGAYAIKDLNEVQIGGYALFLQEKSNGQQTDRIALRPVQKPVLEDPAAFSPAQAVVGLETPPPPPASDVLPDVEIERITDDIILTELLESTQAIEVEQTAAYTIQVINGGPIVAAFDVAVLGVPDEWVKIYPEKINLYEGGRTDITISINPPRLPTSSAGEHHLSIIVTSPNHPERKSVTPAVLNIAPYYDFAIDDVSPKRKVIPFSRRTGAVKMGLHNRGNSLSAFRLVAQDDDNECQFQFEAQNGLKQHGQVEYAIAAGETQPVPIHISPIKRSLVRLSSRQHSYRVSVAQPENEALSLFTMGTAISKPLIGILGIILFLLITAITIFLLFTPRINYFRAENNVIGVGESTTLYWKTYFFTRNLNITGVETPINDNQGNLEIFPEQTVNTYTLSATTWLWNMLNLEPKQSSFTVLAVPGEPEITTFSLSDTDVLVGDEVTLRWSVKDASKVTLTVNGVADTFEDPKDFNGERVLPIEMDTLVSIEAINSLGSAVSSQYIFARPPTIVIEQFEVDKATIYKGEQVTIIWKISGTGMADGGEVTISAFDSVLPLEGELTFFPEESMEFVLSATNRKLKEVRILPVGVLDPEAAPEPPAINFFTAAPDTLTGPGNVEIAWSVSGPFNEIKITNGEETVASGLSAQGFKTIAVSKSGTYVITATYADQSAGKDLKITVNPALLEPTMNISTVYPLTGLEIGDVVTVAINIESPSPEDPPPTGVVIVSDGTSSCPIPLPETACELTFKTPGTKYISATYQGDSNYIQYESEPYGTALEVMGIEITVDPKVKPETGTYSYSQKVTLRIRVEGSNPTRIPNGELRVRRMCDSTAIYSTTCTNDIIGYHKLTDAESGYYEFVDLIVDQMGGNWRLQITFINDSFYSDKTTEISIPVDDAKSPIGISLSTSTTFPYTALSGPIAYAITVSDENASAAYNTPRGTINIIATHSDGTTTLNCSPATQTLTTAGDDRSSTASCTITPSKWGTWTLSGQYRVAADDPWHQDEDQTIGTIAVNSNPTFAFISPPASLIFQQEQTVSLSITRSDTGTAISSGTLACSFPSSGDGTCTCSYNSVSTNWDCTTKPTLTTALPVNRTISFNYTSGSFVNTGSTSRQFSITKAPTTVTLAPELASSYLIGSSLDLIVSVLHAGDGLDPSSGTVDIQLGAGTCDAATGMTTPLNSYTATLSSTGAPRTVSFTSTHATGETLRFCYRFRGDNFYVASSWEDSTGFIVEKSDTTAQISVQPVSSYTIGNTFSITVSANNEDGGSDPTSGDVSIQIGTGTCNTVTGFTSPLETFAGTLNSAKTITFSSTHVAGQNVRFCFKYLGNTNFSASPWAQSDAFIVKAQPTVDTVSDVDLIASQNKDVFTEFTITLDDGVDLASSSLIIVDASSGTTLCPATTTDVTCQLKSSTATTFTYEIAASSAFVWSVKAKYQADSKNLEAIGTAFSITSQYDITMGTVSLTRGTTNLLWAYTNLEADASDYMSTDISSSFTFNNFTSYSSYNTHGITATIVPIDSGGNPLPLDSASGSCTISAGGSIACPNIRVTNSATNNFRVVLASSSSNITGTLSATSAATTVIQNIIEDPGANTTYKIQITDGGCSGTTQQFNVTGYAAGNSDPTQTLLPSDFTLWLWCEKDDDGNDDYDNTWAYTSTNATFSTSMGWNGSTPNMFSFQITPKSSHTGKSACDYKVERVTLTLSLGRFQHLSDIMLGPLVPSVTSLKDFEPFTYQIEIINDDNTREDGIMFDDCGG